VDYRGHGEYTSDECVFKFKKGRPESMSSCCLCSNIASPQLNEIWNKPLLESEHFVVLPSLGSLVEGWLLIVPKKHFLNMGAIPVEFMQELQSVKLSVGHLLKAKYGSVCTFEHGPSKPNKKVGCSVDHAHLHMVPISFDLVQAAAAFMPQDASWVDARPESCRAAFGSGNDYLYVEQPIGCGRIAVHSGFGSQVLRKAIAAGIGKLDRSSWRDYPEIEVVARTIQTLSPVCEGAVSL